MITTIFILFSIIHIILCVLIFLLLKFHCLKVSAQVFPLMVCIPVFGFIMLLSADLISRRQINGRRKIDLHQFSLSEQDFRSISLSRDNTTSVVVPLEEAIIINSAHTRREFMMDIISKGSKDYISLLQKARFSNDGEIAHYASTAIMEVQREYEIKIQKCKELCENNSENIKYYKDLCENLKNYIQSGLIEESVLKIQRNIYADALQKIIDLTRDDPELKIYIQAIDNQIELGWVKTVRTLLRYAFLYWSDNESVWLMKIKYCYKTNNGRELERTINKLKQSRVFLSNEARETVLFWSKSTMKN